ncbi:Plant cysteine oxidase [Arachis hypogaea]|nr:Plant cysteine oxidase [Arachis hypogaea]
MFLPNGGLALSLILAAATRFCRRAASLESTTSLVFVASLSLFFTNDSDIYPSSSTSTFATYSFKGAPLLFSPGALQYLNGVILFEETMSFRLTKLAVDKVMTAPCEILVLYPKHGGNLHCLTAITPCAVLDILSLPDREDEGRKCTYYRDYPYSTFSSD